MLIILRNPPKSRKPSKGHFQEPTHKKLKSFFEDMDFVGRHPEQYQDNWIGSLKRVSIKTAVINC